MSILSEFCLKILEKSVWRYLNLSYFNCLKPYSPSFDLILEIIPHVISQVIPVSQNFLKRRVGNQVSEDWFAHGLNVRICLTSLHVLIAPEGTIWFSVDRPEGKALDLHSLHLLCHVIGVEMHLLNLGVELDVAVCKSKESLEADSCLDQLTISNDEQPFVGFRLYESCAKESAKAATSDNESTQSPDVLGGG